MYSIGVEGPVLEEIYDTSPRTAGYLGASVQCTEKNSFALASGHEWYNSASRIHYWSKESAMETSTLTQTLELPHYVSGFLLGSQGDLLTVFREHGGVKTIIQFSKGIDSKFTELRSGVAGLTESYSSWEQKRIAEYKGTVYVTDKTRLAWFVPEGSGFVEHFLELSTISPGAVFDAQTIMIKDDHLFVSSTSTIVRPGSSGVILAFDLQGAVGNPVFREAIAVPDEISGGHLGISMATNDINNQFIAVAGNSDKIIVFKFEGQSTLKLAAVSNGVVNSTGGVSFELGGSTLLTAVPNLGYAFMGWTGDASGTSNPLILTMDADKSVGATFAPDTDDTDGDGTSNYDELVVYGSDPNSAASTPDDTDGDGLLDTWETAEFGNLDQVPDGDPDGDGLVNLAEQSAGTNPNRADTDGDGVPDGLEVKEKTSPVDAADFNALSKGLLAYYPFDENANDAVGQANGALLNGAIVNGGYLNLDGADDYVQIPQKIVPTSGSYSVSIFARQNVDQTYQLIELISQGYTGGPGFYIGHSGRSVRFSDFWSETGVAIPSFGSWNHYVLVVDSVANVSRLYLNDVLCESKNQAIVTTSGGDATRFGRQFGGFNEFFNGSLDNVRIYNRALSESEVGQIYTVDRPPTPKFQIIQGSYTWLQAKADAESRGGRLAVLNTEPKQLEAALLLPNSSRNEYFIGATDEAVEGTWKWVDGSAMSYSNWGGGEPNGDDYLSITTGGWGGIGFSQWNDTFLNPSDYNRGYLLEMPGDSVWAPQITVPPVDETAAQGGNVTLSVTATGATLQYQWRKDGIDIAGATLSTLSLNPAQTSDSGRYTVVISNAAGSVTSGEALVTVAIPPAIEVQPVGVNAYLGDSVTLAVTATGSGLNYQWQKNGYNLAGATAATLDLGSVQASDAASYTVVISNALGSVTSSAAMVTAVPDVRDSDGDGLTNYDEVFVYGTNPRSADTDGDGLSDPYELGLGRYSVVLGSFTWQQAEADAVAKGGTLATFASQGEWLWAQESIGADALYDVTGLWIGATDSAVEGTWLWITGEPVTYSHWAVGEPNNGNNSDYAAIAGDLGGETGDWYDYRATTKRDGYILETGYATDPTVADADQDRLSDGEEQEAGTNPFLADTDGDGLSDGIEVKQTRTNPQLADSNGNGIADLLEDSDGDGLSNQEELALGTNPGMTDSDGDGLLDLEELGRNRFSLVQGAFTYATATANAAALGGHLATFTDAAELAEAMREIGSTALDNLSGSWIGATDVAVEGEWRWVTGEAITFSPWAVGKPNNIYNADYAAMVGGKNGGVVGKWADFSATALLDSYLLKKGFVTNPAVADTDGDGANDGEETEWGSDPEDVSKLPEWKVTIDRIHSSSDRIRLRFPTLVGASYRVEVSADLNTWQALTVDILGDGNLKTHEVIRGGATQQFFRVKQN
jgi:hypothetical protein